MILLEGIRLEHGARVVFIVIDSKDERLELQISSVAINFNFNDELTYLCLMAS